MKPIALALLLLTAVTHVLADEKAVQKYRNYTPEQLKSLPEKVLHSEVPMMYTFAARRGLSAGAELLFAMELNRLMYAGLHDYKAAVRAFQADLGDKPTGVLTVWQIHELEKRSEMQKLSQILFPDRFSGFKTDDYASIQGTMMIIDEKIAWPINHVRVKCYKTENQCQLDLTKVAVPNDKSWSQSLHVMVDETEHYTISRWGQDSIDAEPRETIGGCRTTSMNFNFKTKEFFYITRNAGGNCEVLGATLERLAKPRIAQIVDGSKIIRDEFAKIERAAYDVLASEFKKRVDKINAKAK
jgi:hypothetical protein